jgi:hypothetical protein
LTDLPVASYPVVLRVAVPRYRCLTADCGRAVFNQDLGKLAAPRSSTTRRRALADWLATQPADFTRSVPVIAMDGFAGYKTRRHRCSP